MDDKVRTCQVYRGFCNGYHALAMDVSNEVAPHTTCEQGNDYCSCPESLTVPPTDQDVIGSSSKPKSAHFGDGVMGPERQMDDVRSKRSRGR